jgi:hypothetical protein
MDRELQDFEEEFSQQMGRNICKCFHKSMRIYANCQERIYEGCPEDKELKQVERIKMNQNGWIIQTM